MDFFSKPPQKDILREQIKDSLGIFKTRLIIFPVVMLFPVVIKLITSFPFSNLVFLILGYYSAISLLSLYLLERWRDNPKVIIVLDISKGLFLIEIVLNLFIIYYLSPVFIYLFGSFVWLAFFFYLFYSSASVGPVGYSYGRGYINSCFILSCLCCGVVFFWEYSGIAPSYESLAFLPGSLYQRPISSLILFLLLIVIFTGARSFGSEIWKKFRRINQQLRQKTEELEELNRVLEERVKERTKELEEERATLKIKVQARTKELQELAGGLEEEVKRRTKEVQARMEELERFYKLAVGRELKMKELKQEIERLKKEQEKSKRSN